MRDAQNVAKVTRDGPLLQGSGFLGEGRSSLMTHESVPLQGTWPCKGVYFLTTAAGG